MRVHHYLCVLLALLPLSWAWLFSSSAPKQTCCSQLDNNYCFSDKTPYNKMPIPECFAVTFKLFTRQTGSDWSNRKVINKYLIPSEFSPGKKTVVVVHGFNDDPLKNKQWMLKIMDNLLTVGDMNVIVSDWSAGSKRLYYAQAAANSRFAGKAVSELFVRLYARGLSRSNTYCVGHSLGAHACGYASQYLTSSHKFARITGLDPAGPEFLNLPEYARLSIQDADFVDIIHTNGGTNYFLDYGFLPPMGHVDFYPNGGQKQPGCLNKRHTRSAHQHPVELSDLTEELRRDAKELRSHLQETAVEDVAPDALYKKEESRSGTADDLLDTLKLLLAESKRRNAKHLAGQSDASENGGGQLTQRKLDSEEKRKALSEEEKTTLLETLERMDRGSVLKGVSCSHGMAGDYYIATILHGSCFTATHKCTGYNGLPDSSCYSCSPNCPVMGYHADTFKSSFYHGKYYLKTHGTTPNFNC